VVRELLAGGCGTPISHRPRCVYDRHERHPTWGVLLMDRSRPTDDAVWAGSPFFRPHLLGREKRSPFSVAGTAQRRGVTLLFGAVGQDGAPSRAVNAGLKVMRQGPQPTSYRTRRSPRHAVRVRAVLHAHGAARRTTPTPGVQHRSMHPPLSADDEPDDEHHTAHAWFTSAPGQSHSPNPHHDRLRTPGYAHLRTVSAYTVLRTPMTDAF
jgi:hypothetical protein